MMAETSDGRKGGEQSLPGHDSQTGEVSLSLFNIMRLFRNPINEEQAWGICYQCAKYYLHGRSQEKYQILYSLGIHAIYIHKDGEIIVKRPQENYNELGKGPPASSRRIYDLKETKLATEQTALQALGQAIYEALDYGIAEGEERPLAPDLENLIYYMTYCDESEADDESQNADDEGIEKDAEDEPPNRTSFRHIETLCTKHHSSEKDASQHYRAVCRALVAEAHELTSFLSNITKSEERLSTSLPDVDESGLLDDLKICDWARLWVQVVGELRRGVRLKKVEQVNLPPVEYELTPFEMLLEDIRSCRYSLNKIMLNKTMQIWISLEPAESAGSNDTIFEWFYLENYILVCGSLIQVNGDIPPKVKNDAHAVILDFIRSRPPLHSENFDCWDFLNKTMQIWISLQPAESAGSNDTHICIVFIEKIPRYLRLWKPYSKLNELYQTRYNRLNAEFRTIRQVKKRELKSPPRTPLDPHQCLMKEIRSSHELRPVRNGRLLVETSRTKLNNKEDESPLPIRRVIKPDFNLLLNNSFELASYWDDESSGESEAEQESLMPTVDAPALSPDLCVSSSQLDSAWHQAVTRDLATQERDPRLSRRHTIMVCQSPEENKVVTQQELPPLEKYEDPTPGRPSWTNRTPNKNITTDSSPSNNVPKWRASLSQKTSPSSPSKSVKLVTIAEDGKQHGNNRSQSKILARRGILKRQENTSKIQNVCEHGEDVCDSVEDIECSLHELNDDQLMHVSWKSACSRRQSTNSSTTRCEGCRPISKHWQNPIECLSLTLEEVIHIRSVLTKAELESLISKQELFNLVSKGKVCFTCKLTRFSLFGQWGTKCKLCKKNVCNKCLRKIWCSSGYRFVSPNSLDKISSYHNATKRGRRSSRGRSGPSTTPRSMNVPTEHFQNIPVYTLSPSPIATEITEAVELIVGTGSKPTSPGIERRREQYFDSKGRKKILVRSKSVTDKRTNSLKGPLMSICCDCKTMITEIIRASRTSIALIKHDQDVPQKFTPIRTEPLQPLTELS